MKVSGIPSGNKLIKMVSPHVRISFLSTCEDIMIIFDNIFVPLTELKFVGV